MFYKISYCIVFFGSTLNLAWSWKEEKKLKSSQSYVRDDCIGSGQDSDLYIATALSCTIEKFKRIWMR